MHRRITNSTRYDLKTRKISWRVEWAFASAGVNIVDNLVSEETVLAEVGPRCGGVREEGRTGMEGPLWTYRAPYEPLQGALAPPGSVADVVQGHAPPAAGRSHTGSV